MRIFLAGATGVLGRLLVPALVTAGHEVVGTTRDQDKADSVRAAGAEPVVLDPLDRDTVHAAVAAAKPEVVLHQLTALTGLQGFRRMDRQFAATNRLRTVGVDILLAAAVDAGARRFLVQSFTGWPNARTGPLIVDENHPLDPDPPAAARESLAAIRHLESVVTGTTAVDGLALRYGLLYGPGTGFEHGGQLVAMAHKRQLPVVGGGQGIWSFVHIEDAASATVAAVTHGDPGTYNITDDEPAPAAEWIPYLAATLGAPPPRHLPAWPVRLILGGQGVSMMTRTRGSSNAKAKETLGWRPAYPTWREGFRTGLG